MVCRMAELCLSVLWIHTHVKICWFNWTYPAWWIYYTSFSSFSLVSWLVPSCSSAWTGDTVPSRPLCTGQLLRFLQESACIFLFLWWPLFQADLSWPFFSKEGIDYLILLSRYLVVFVSIFSLWHNRAKVFFSSSIVPKTQVSLTYKSAYFPPKRVCRNSWKMYICVYLIHIGTLHT